MNENIIRIDTADKNGNGVDEIYASSYEGHYANSFVIEYKEGKYERMADSQRWFFRTYGQPGEGIKLIGQKADITNPFSGTFYRFLERGYLEKPKTG